MSARPWWLEAGAERCEVCELAHHYEITVRCVACDRPLCPSCAVEVRETRSLWCADCHAAEDTG